MVTSSQKHLIITMGIIVVVSLISGLTLFYFSKDAANKKSDQLTADLEKKTGQIPTRNIQLIL